MDDQFIFGNLGSYDKRTLRYERVYPPELVIDENISDRDFQKLQEHFSNLPYILYEMENEIRNQFKKNQKLLKKELDTLDNDLTMIAKNLLKGNHFLLFGAAGQIIIFLALRKRNETECQNLLNDFDHNVQKALRVTGNKIKQAEQTNIPEAQDSDESIKIMRHRATESLLWAAARFPSDSSVLDDVQELCAKRFAELGDKDFSSYGKIIKDARPLVDSSDYYPSALPTLEKMLDRVTLMSGWHLDGLMKRGNKDSVRDKTIQMSDVILDIALEFHDVPSIHMRAVSAFKLYCGMLEKANLSCAVLYLHDTRTGYKTAIDNGSYGADLAEGIKKMAAILEESIGPYITSSTFYDRQDPPLAAGLPLAARL